MDLSDDFLATAAATLRFVIPQSIRDWPGIVIQLGLHIKGTENGNILTDINSAPDIVTVEEAPQLSILTIETPPSVTRSIQALWEVKMILHNTGEASVEIDLDETEIFWEIAGRRQDRRVARSFHRLNFSQLEILFCPEIRPILLYFR